MQITVELTVELTVTPGPVDLASYDGRTCSSRCLRWMLHICVEEQKNRLAAS